LSTLDRVIIEVGHMGGDENADKLYFTLGASGSHPTLCFDSGSVVDAGAWYHFVAVVGPDFNTGYLNGREMTDRYYNFGDENDSVFFDDVVDQDVLWMGRAGFSLEPHWCDGVIDEVRVYDRPLTSSEVEALYRQGCPADIDVDGEVGITDFLLLLGVWGPCAGCPEDVDGDGDVGIQDFLLLLATWGPC
jgi:hypothetical protein